MRGIVTFTTDFGLRDPFVAAMKGQALRRCPELQLVDITHEIPRFQPGPAAFWLERLARYFPDRTVHVAVVDPGVGGRRRLVAVSADGQFWLAPDNGLLAGIAARPGARTRLVDPGRLAAWGLAVDHGPTFQGRDLLAPLAALLASGGLQFEDLGEPTEPVPGGALAAPEPCARGWRGRVVICDIFGNIFSNIEFSPDVVYDQWAVLAGGQRLPLVRTYADARSGELVALVNSWGLIEIAEVKGNAALRLGVSAGDPVVLERVAGDA